MTSKFAFQKYCNFLIYNALNFIKIKSSLLILKVIEQNPVPHYELKGGSTLPVCILMYSHSRSINRKQRTPLHFSIFLIFGQFNKLFYDET
jgi:hypothetical protein